MTLAEHIYAQCCAQAVIQDDRGQLTKATLSLFEAYAHLAASSFTTLEDLTHDQLRAHYANCYDEFAAAI